MTWNHRVVEFREGLGVGDEPVLMICEVFYDENDVPVMRNEGARAIGSTFAELQLDLDHMGKALKQPRLTESDFAKGRT